MTSLRRLLAPLALLSIWLLVPGADAALPSSGGELGTLKPGHPRLIAEPGCWQRIQANAAQEPLLRGLVQRIERDADALLTEPPVRYHKTGRRLLDVSREVLRRTLVLSTSYRLTGNAAYLKRAEQEMVTAAEFSDWNPSHYLDVGEMTAALALGYDWLFAELTPEARRTIRTAIIEKGLTPAQKKGPYTGWQNGTNNWNQVCWGGMVLGALAIGDEVPGLAGATLERARKGMVSGLRSYAPDGVYQEGPGYWSYGTTYSVMTFSALRTALGTDWNLPEMPGFLASCGAFLQMNAPTGLFFNYSDSGEGGSVEPAVFWFAQRAGDAGLIAPEIASLQRIVENRRGSGRKGEGARSRFMPLTLLWWPKGAANSAPALPLRYHGEGPNPIAVFRSSWSDPNALYLATKGGSASLSHAHMDAGSFVFELDGVRWARDLGMQDYSSLESKGIDLWNRAQDSQRWTVFRLNNRAHNTLTIGDHLHRMEGNARIVGFSASPENAGVLFDLTPVLAGQVNKATRGFRVPNDRSVLIQDELTGLKPGADVCWTMVTAATAELAEDGRAAVLKESGKTLHLRVHSPAAAKVSVITADPPADGFDAPNPNRHRVVVHVAAPRDGTVTLVVSLSAEPMPAQATRPLASWALQR